MKHHIILAATIGALIIPESFGQMHIKRTITPLPDPAIFFGPSMGQIEDAIRKFAGEATESPRRKVATNIERVNRPCPYTKTEKVLPNEEWKCTSWVVEIDPTYDEGLSSVSNDCTRCSRFLNHNRFCVNFWCSLNWTNEVFKCQCGRAYRLEKARYAQFRSKVVVQEYVNKIDSSCVTRVPEVRVEVLNLVTESEFYDRFFDDEKSRKLRYDEWAKGPKRKHIEE